MYTTLHMTDWPNMQVAKAKPLGKLQTIGSLEGCSKKQKLGCNANPKVHGQTKSGIVVCKA